MKNKKVLMMISIITIISFVIGFSYAYFTTIVIGNDTSSSNRTTSGSLKLNFNGLDYVDMQNSKPGDSDTMTFTVTNSGTLPVSAYQIYLSNVINTYSVKSEMVYELDCTSSDAVTCLDKVQTEIPSTSGVGLTQTSIAPGTTHTYILTVTFIDTGLNQDYNQGKSLIFKITTNEQFELPTLIAVTNGYFWDYKTSISSITFEDGIDVSAGAFASWDVSELQDGTIMAYIIDDGLGASTYNLFIQTNNDLIIANPDSSLLFYDFTKLTTINNLSLLNTSKVTDMWGMFYNCSSLVNLDVSSFDTSSVIYMYDMFDGCSNLTSLDLSSFDTSKVIDMTWMFNNCLSLINVNLSSFNTSNVTSIEAMFQYCGSLTSLDLSTFDTSKVTHFFCMFYECSSLTSLNISSFSLDNCISMQSMFFGCGGLTSLDLSMLDTSNIIYMGYLFYGCGGLTVLDLSGFDTSKVTQMQYMFKDCDSLITIDLSSFNTAIVTNMVAMFGNCSSLVTLDLSSFVTSVLLKTGKEADTWSLGMFEDCSSLTSIDMRNMVFSTVTLYSNMFADITSGINIVVKDATAQTWITSRLTDAGKTGNVIIV